MPYPTSITSAEQLEQWLNKTKTKKSQQLQRKINRWNKNIVKGFKKNIQEGIKEALNNKDRAELTNILQQHHKEVVQSFTPFDMFDPFNPEIFKKIIRDILVMVNSQSFKRSERILLTTEKILRKSLQQAEDFLREENELLSEEEVPAQELAKSAARIITGRLRHRLALIGITETNWVAEATRWIQSRDIGSEISWWLFDLSEALRLENFERARQLARQIEQVSDIFPIHGFDSIHRFSKKVTKRLAKKVKITQSVREARKLSTSASKIVKVWRSRRDKRVRRSHQLADGKQKKIGLLFENLNGELEYPGDTLHGAGAAEIANCRCWLVYQAPGFAVAISRTRWIRD